MSFKTALVFAQNASLVFSFGPVFFFLLYLRLFDLICESEVLEVSEYILCVSNGFSILREIDVVGEEFVGVEE